MNWKQWDWFENEKWLVKLDINFNLVLLFFFSIFLFHFLFLSLSHLVLLNVMNFHMDHMDEITENWNPVEDKNETQRFGNVTTSIYFLIFFPLFISFRSPLVNFLPFSFTCSTYFAMGIFMCVVLPKAQRNLVSCSIDWCMFLL